MGKSCTAVRLRLAAHRPVQGVQLYLPRGLLQIEAEPMEPAEAYAQNLLRRVIRQQSPHP
ncbi:hypothetical protein GCM10017559_61290 [Streptosporangium longisporum]|uniref:Uncharacterized protein n=1 Tax=Streptosporangium longisporum TaxID=46187 RepID=A0ABP6L1D3_9ACTN